MKGFIGPGAVTMLVSIVVTCLELYLFQKILWLVVPGLLALTIYYCLRPLSEWLKLRGLRHESAAAVLAGALVVATTAVVGLTAVPLLAKATVLQGKIEQYLAGGQNLVRESIQSVETVFPALKQFSLAHQVDTQMRDISQHFAPKYMGTIVLQTLKCLPALFLVPYLTYFLLQDSRRLKRYLIRSVPNAFFEKALLLFARLDESLRSYFQGLVLLTLLDTLSLGAGLQALGVSPAFFLALTAALLSWMPYLGSVAGCIIVVLVASTDFPSHPSIAYGCLALFLAVRMLDDFVFLPLTIGRKMHIHPLLSVLMFFLGATVAGATGLVLALPVFGVVTVVGETAAQVLADRRLRARYQLARRLGAVPEKLCGEGAAQPRPAMNIASKWVTKPASQDLPLDGRTSTNTQ